MAHLNLADVSPLTIRPIAGVTAGLLSIAVLAAWINHAEPGGQTDLQSSDDAHQSVEDWHGNVRRSHYAEDR